MRQKWWLLSFSQLMLVLFIGSFLSQLAAQEVFRYTDSNGKTHYTTSAAKIPLEYQGQAGSDKPLPHLNKSKSYTYPIIMPDGPLPAAGNKKVEVFVTRWCPYCKALEAFLKSEKISYQRRDIESDPGAEREYNRLGRPGVPVTKIGSNVITGFDKGELLSALGKGR